MVALRFQRAPHRFAHREMIGLAGLVVAGVALSWPHLPQSVLPWFSPGCHFRAITGWPCGSCGFTRAFVRAIHLDLDGALAVSPLGTTLFIAWVLYGLIAIGGLLFPSLPRPTLVATAGERRILVAAALAAYAANWAYLLFFRFLTGACPA